MSVVDSLYVLEYKQRREEGILLREDCPLPGSSTNHSTYNPERTPGIAQSTKTGGNVRRPVKMCTNSLFQHHLTWTKMLTCLLWTMLLLVKHGTCQGNGVKQVLSVPEHSPIGHIIGTVGQHMTNPPDPPYTLLAGADAIEIANDGSIQVKAVLDRETTNEYTLVVLSSFGDIITIVVTVTDINDNSPVFPNPVMDVTLSESIPLDVKSALGSAVDPDEGINTTQRYEIVEGNVDNAFRLGSKRASNGILYLDLEINRELDYEETPSYTLVIRAYDGGNPPKYGEMRVNVKVVDANDNQPIFNQSRYFAKVPEDVTVGTSVLQVYATDRDSGDNGKISYHIDRRSDPNEKFRIDASDGKVYVQKNLDYEVKQNYELIVVAKDNGTQKLQTTAIVSVEIQDINDNAPVIELAFLTEDGTGKISETAQTGDFVARISVSDADMDGADPSVDVTLNGGEGYFGLTTRDNVKYLVILSKPLDREFKPYYTLTVVATDNGIPPLTTTKSFSVYVTDMNDNPPRFSESVYYADIQEVVPPGSSVVQLQAEDEDDGDNSLITYQLLDTPETHSDWFQIDTRTGLIMTKTSVDCETSSEPRLTVVATDSGTPPLSATATVVVRIRDVNDNQPIFDQSFYNVSVPESITVGSCILTVSATDPDCGANAQVSYSVAANLGFQTPQEFEVQSSTGKICITKPLDFEKKRTHDFPVVASDQDDLDTTAMVKVTVVDVNDNNPIFYPSRYSVNLEEGTAVGSEIIAVQATDSDSGNLGTISYSIQGGNPNGLFTIVSNSGVLKLAKALPSSPRLYNVAVMARDGGGLQSMSSAYVNITVLGSDQNPPEFTSSLYKFSVPEDGGINTLVGKVSASAPGNPRVSYSVVSGDPDGQFTVDPVGGEIRVVKALDHDTTSSVLLNIQAEAGSPPSYGSAQVNISITDVNDNAPVFSVSSIEIPVKEDVPLTSTIYVVQATDRDSGDNGKVRYSVEDSSGTFAVDSVTGQIRLQRSLDHESTDRVQFTVTAYDMGSPSKQSSISVRIVVQDCNDNPPLFTQSVYSFDIEESLAVNTKFDKVTATDADSGNNGRITYMVQNGENLDVFGIFSENGQLYNRMKLDRERHERYQLKVVAIDNGIPALSSTAQVIINILDDNDNRPEFLEDSYLFYMEENKPGNTLLGYVSATDRDQSDDLVYYLVGNNAHFSIESTNGEIVTRKQLDRERMETHEFQVKVSDSGENPQSATVDVRVQILDINDNAPQFDQASPMMVYIQENRPKNTLVALVSATDSDKGENSTITYSLDKASESRDYNMFDINPRNGQITTKEVLDHETKAQYMLRVIASDGGIPRKSSVLSVQVVVEDENETPPEFENANVSFTVQENTTPGTIIGSVVAKDKDSGENGRVHYYIISGNLFGTFGVNGTTGSIFITQPLDYEEASAYTVQIRAIDSSAINPLSSIINVKITIIDKNDNPPVFEENPVVVSIQENVPPGTHVYTLSAIDKDSGDRGNVQYEITSQSPDGAWFSIDKNNGYLRLDKALDFEVTPQFSVVIKASDQPSNPSGRLFSTVSALILIEDINDNAPKFEIRDQFDVMEDEPMGYPVVHVVATDADSHDNGKVTYSIVSGNQKGHFHLDSSSGLMTIAKPLDRENIGAFNLNISAKDYGHPRQTSYKRVTIHVVDVNDNAPIFEYSVYRANITEDQPLHTFVTQIKASDKDIDLNAELQYLIPDGIANKSFAIDRQTGRITTNIKLDREQKQDWVITAYVKDAAFPALYDTTTILVSVLDINDNAPVFKESQYYLEVPENGQQSVLHMVMASDGDSGSNGEVTYSIVGGNVDNKFSIDSMSGELSCGPLDRELHALYLLTVQATDGGDPPRSSTSSIQVKVLDINDNDPKFRETSYSKSIPEDMAVGTSILKVEATDVDEGVNSKISYAMSNDANGQFKIDNITGVITTAGEFDREKTSSYSFEVYATDGGLYDPRSESARVDITILDVNDNAPVFEQIPYKAEISQDHGINQYVVRVSAVDKDDGINGQVTYSFAEDNQYFLLDAESGDIKTKKSLLEPSAVIIHHIDVIARDMADSPRSSKGVVEIRVGNAQARGTLRFTNMTYNALLDEHASEGTEVVRVQARFFSGGGSGLIRYGFASSSNDDNIFTIDEISGRILVKDPRQLDYESNRRMRLIVSAESDKSYGYSTVWVTLKDINDNAPRFTQDRYYSRVWEGNPRGTFVAQITASDKDEGANKQVYYSIRSGNTHGAFVIDPPHTGIVKTNIILDREITDMYKLVVEAFDGGKPQQTSTAILRIQVIDTNDNAPFFPPYPVVKLREGSELGTSVIQVTANDIDLNPQLIYQFALGGNPNEAFSIDRYNGKISVARALDHEFRASYNLRVMASDNDHNVTTDVIVKVIDENDNPPVFAEQSYEVTVYEMTGPHVSIITVNATDKDSEENSRITYSMPAVDGFYINPQTGSVYTNKTILYNPSQPTVHLVVTARDHGNPSLSAMVAVRLQVIDINNHAPVFTLSVYSGEVSEDEEKGVTILTVIATDGDNMYENKKIDYSILSGNGQGMFHVAQSTGEIILNGELDRELTQQYSLVIMARDRGDPPLNSTTMVKIKTTDVNDNSPQFNASEYRTTVEEDIAVGVSVGRVFAFDRDADENGRVEYKIMSGNDDNCFEIDRDTGIISVRTLLDHESRELHTLIIRAMDSSTEFKQLSAFTKVTINVTDQNEFTPHFPVLVYLETVHENEPPGTFVFKANAIDDDGGYFGQVRYTLVPLSDQLSVPDLFQVDAKSGDVTTKRVLRQRDQRIYNFLIKATDTGGSAKTVNVMVEVKSRDEFTPIFVKNEYSFEVAGNAKAGDMVGQIRATDKDGSSGYVTYSFREEHPFFAINRTTGIIIVTKDLQSPDEKRRKRDVSVNRVKRALSEDSIVLRVLASSGSATSEVVLQIAVDRSCMGCEASAAQGGNLSLSGTPLVLLLVFTIIAIIIIVVIVLLYLRGRRAKQTPPHTSYDSSSFGTLDEIPPPPPSQFAPPPYNESQNRHYNITTSERSDNSHSASSGRGSAEEGDEVDEEIRMINATPMQAGHRMPDSGIQQDDDAMSEHSAHNHQEYLARLGIDSTKITNKNKAASSVESMHQFSDEGGGEGDGLDISNLVYTKLGQVEAAENMAIMDGTRQFGFGDAAETSHGGSLSSVINSEEEFSGSYNWDYLLDWGPQYQPLAAVFSEIARLKDDNIKPKTKPTQIVPQQGRAKASVDGHLVNNALPPPIITDAPPKGFTLSHASQNQSNSNLSSSSNANSMNSARTSQLTNVSLPKSPLSYESSYGSAVMSPSFTPSLSPLGTRSPSISPLVTPKGIGSVSGQSSHGSSGHNSPGARAQARRHRQPNGVLFNGLHASSESEQEFRI